MIFPVTDWGGDSICSYDIIVASYQKEKVGTIGRYLYKRIAVVMIFLILLTYGVSACGKDAQEPEELSAFTQDVNEEEGYIILSGRTGATSLTVR